MEIVINISDRLKRNIEVEGFFLSPSDEVELLNAVLKGTPLPKGHGRLGDLGEVIDRLNEAQIEGADTYKGLGEAKQIVIEASSIIKADKERE